MREKRESTRELGLLEEIERDPDTTQASMEDKLGVAVGTVNWHLKRLIAKCYVKLKRAERKKLRYSITPEGILYIANLTMAYLCDADLRGANLSGANLHNVELWGVDLCRANLSRTDLRVADFGGTILGDTDLAGARGLADAQHGAPSTMGGDRRINPQGMMPAACWRGSTGACTGLLGLRNIPMSDCGWRGCGSTPIDLSLTGNGTPTHGCRTPPPPRYGVLATFPAAMSISSSTGDFRARGTPFGSIAGPAVLTRASGPWSRIFR